MLGKGMGSANSTSKKKTKSSDGGTNFLAEDKNHATKELDKSKMANSVGKAGDKKNPKTNKGDDSDDEKTKSPSKDEGLTTSHIGKEQHKDNNNDGDDDDPIKNLKRLHAACQKENLPLVETLMTKHRVPVGKPDAESGKVALHFCVSNKDTDVIDAVIKNDSTCLNHRDRAGFSPLLFASVAGNLKMVKFLKERGASVKVADNEGHSSCHWAAVCGHEEVLKYLQESGADLSVMDKNGATPLHYAVHGNDDVTEDKSLKMTRMLLEKKVKVDAVDEDGRTPLLWAASSGREKICEALLNAGANVEAADHDKLNGLHSAAAKGHPKCIEILLDRKAKIESTDKNGCTPLFYAIHQSELECAKLLLNKKANPNHRDVKGRSVSHCAAATGNLEAMKLLKQHKADQWIQSKETGDFPIHEAAMAGHTDVVQFLMDGIEPKTNSKDAINRGNAKGKTCLHMAALSNNLPLCKYLVQHGADVKAPMKSENGEMLPYDCAVLKNNTECANFLKQNGARSAKEDKNTSPPSKVSTKPTDKKPEEAKKTSEPPKKNHSQTMEISCQTDDDHIKKNVHVINSESQTTPTIIQSKHATDNEIQSPAKSFPSRDKQNGNTTDSGTQTIETKNNNHNNLQEHKKDVNIKPKPVADNSLTKDKSKTKKSSARDVNDENVDSDQYSSDGGGEDSGTYSEEEKHDNNKKVKQGDNDDRKKTQPGKLEQQQKQNKTNNRVPERGQVEARRLVNLNVHPTIIREQVKAYETKRLAAMKLNHSNRMKMNGKGFSEARLVRKLARDYNEDARPEDRIPSGHFKTMKEFDNFLRGEINIADVDERRLKKLEKVKPIYYITF